MSSGVPAGAEHDAIPWSRVIASPNVWLLGTIMTVGATLAALKQHSLAEAAERARDDALTARNAEQGQQT